MPVGHVVREWRFVRTPLVAIYNYVSLKASVDRVNKTVETRPGEPTAPVLTWALTHDTAAAKQSSQEHCCASLPQACGSPRCSSAPCRREGAGAS